MLELGLKPESTFHALGVPWQIDLANPLDKRTRTSILQLVANFEATFSRFRQDSLVTALKLAQLDQEIVFPEYAEPLFALYDVLFQATKGRIDPCVGAALEVLGYTKDVHFEIDASGELVELSKLPKTLYPQLISSVKPPSSKKLEPTPEPNHTPKLKSKSKLPSSQNRDDNHLQSPDSGYLASDSIKWNQLRKQSKNASKNAKNVKTTLVCIAPGISLDFGAVGKGFLIDLIANLLQEAGHNEFVIDASGDFRVHLSPQKRPLRIALEDPSHPGRAIGVAKIHRGAFCSSGITRRRWKDEASQLTRHHLVNALSGQPVTGVLGVWVAIGETNQSNTGNQPDTSDHSSILAQNDRSNDNNKNSRNSNNSVSFPYITALCDGIATALFSSSATELRQTFDFEYLLLDSNRRVSYSAGFLA